MVEDFVKERLDQIPKNLRPAVEILIRQKKNLTELNDHLMAAVKYWREDAMWWMEQCEKSNPDMFKDAV